MSTNSRSRRLVLVAGAATVSLGVLLAVGLLLRAYGPGNIGNGFLVGAGLAIVASAVAGLRLWRSPERTTTAERALLRAGDERDDAVLTRSLALLGILALPLTGVAAIAIALGAPVDMSLALLLVAQLSVAVLAFVMHDRRG